jgi:tRNA (Thr-GGU) A37 N-methylase
MIPPHDTYQLQPIGHLRSVLRTVDEAPRQGSEGAPDAYLDVDPTFARGLLGITAGDELIVITWLHRAKREVLGWTSYNP